MDMNETILRLEADFSGYVGYSCSPCGDALASTAG